MDKKAMIDEIMITVAANQLPEDTNEILIGLVFCSETALRVICSELHIVT